MTSGAPRVDGAQEDPHPIPVEAVREALAHTAHLLPDLGPIGVFIHHNTLHAFQHLPFHEAIAKASALYGAEPYLSEAEFRAAHAQGRIRAEDIEGALAGIPEDPVGRTGLRVRDLVRVALLHPVEAPSAADVLFQLEEGLLTRAVPGIAPTHVKLLWQEAARLVAHRPERSPPRARRSLGADGTHRDALRDLTGEDLYDHVLPTLIYATSAYLDEGLAHWAMPGREQGFLFALADLWQGVGEGPARWFDGASNTLRRMRAERHRPPENWIVESFTALGVDAVDMEAHIRTLLLALPGWAGMIARLERNPADRGAEAPPANLAEWFAVFMALYVSAVRDMARRHGMPMEAEPLAARWNAEPAGPGRALHAPHLVWTHSLWRVMLHGNVSPAEATTWRPSDADAVLAALDDHPSLVRRRLWHEAYEARHAAEVLDALHAFQRQGQRNGRSPRPAERPSCQVVCCLDEREESFRRAMEEIDPSFETWGAAGFFGLAMNFRGLDDVRATPHCPVGVDPTHEVVEVPLPEDAPKHARRRTTRTRVATMEALALTGSRSLVRGAATTFALGMVSGFALTLRVLFPRATGRWSAWIRSRVFARPRSTLTLLANDGTPHRDAPGNGAGGGAHGGGLPLGYTVEEATDRVHGLLETMGLTESFAPIVLFLGHGSATLNNPHESAYECGACRGQRGAPNARAFAALANDPRIREGLRRRGIQVDDSTWFVGGVHDTCSDEVTCFDVERIPSSLRAAFAHVESVIARARAANAEERCRRFESAPWPIDPEAALRHVEARAMDLAEPRPECGHGTNAVCIVGRRARTRGLFLDRRAFLVSYDPKGDASGKILGRILSAVGPVCGGISLEYYFSRVDNERYGAGTKLPHNVTGFLGVMNGPSSDLRTGLPWQMVEIHEPLRLLLVVETTPALLLEVIAAQPPLAELLRHRWVRFVTWDPDDGSMHIYGDGGFQRHEPRELELPEVARSREWFLGHLDNVPPALVRDALAVVPGSVEALGPGGGARVP